MNRLPPELAAHILLLAREGSLHVNVSIWELDMHTPGEQALIDTLARDVDQSALPTCTVMDMFLGNVHDNPSAIAIWSPTTTHTREDFARLVVQAAAALTANGVCPGMRVALLVHEGVAMATMLMAILMTGACVVPIDPCLPDARIKHMLEDAGAQFLVAHTRPTAAPQHLRTLLLDELNGYDSNAPDNSIECRATLDMESHVIYTSGTTGRPKGVVCTHRNLAAYALVKNTAHRVDENSRVFLASAFTFDPCLGDVVATLAAGAVLCLAPRDDVLSSLGHLLAVSMATHVLATPALWDMVDHSPDQLRHLQCVALGGEPMAPRLIERWAKHVRLCNTYGVTEAAVYQSLVEAQPGCNPRLIGWPFPSVKFRIANHLGLSMPVDSVGELLIGGPQVAMGYTSGPHPAFTLVHGERWYRTGDLAHLSRQGVVLHGRADFQVKIRGQRVELDEIDAVVQECSFVLRAVTILRNALLICYVIVTQGCPDVGLEGQGTCDGECAGCVAVRLHCGRMLPRHMVPHAVVAMNAFPMTVNNKVDRATLPPAPEHRRHAPLTPAQQTVAEGWTQVLGIAPDLLGPRTHFDRLGGDSLAALRTVRAIRIAVVGEENVQDPEDHRGIHAFPWGVQDFLARPVLADYAQFLVDAGALSNGDALGPNTCDTVGDGADTSPMRTWDGLDEGSRALHQAATEGYADVLSSLLDTGVSPNGAWSKANPGVTPLHAACFHGKVECVALLLERGANKNAVDKLWATPGHYAASKCGDALRLLIQHGAAPYTRDKNKQTVLHWAARAGHDDGIVLCRELAPKLDMNLFDRWGRTPLHWAVLNGHRSTVELCIALGGEVNACLPDKIQERRTRLINETALHVAMRMRYDAIASVLLVYGANMEALDSLGNRPGEVNDPFLLQQDQ